MIPFFFALEGFGGGLLFVSIVRIAVVGAFLSGTVYAAVVYAFGGHTGILWGARRGPIPGWRRRWLALSTNGYSLGLLTFIALVSPDPTWTFLGLALFIAGALASFYLPDVRIHPRRPAWVVSGTMAAMILIAWGVGGTHLATMFGGAPRLVYLAAALWTEGAALAAMEVWRAGSTGWERSRSGPRGRLLLPAR